MLRWCGAPFFCAVTGGMPAVFGGFLRGGEGCVVFCALLRVWRSGLFLALE